MSAFGPKPGVWWFSSKSDSRWDENGRTESLSAMYMPNEAKKALERLKKQLGEPPLDLEFGGMKD